jgi:hypothetical protein
MGLRNVHVLPMITDAPLREAWRHEHFDLYASLLSVIRDRILRQDMEFTADTRNRYFTVSDEVGDIFADPDTGVEPRARAGTGHIRRREIAALLPQGSSRIVLVYQHSYREGDYAAETLDRIRTDHCLLGCQAFAYKGGSVSMVFISRDAARLEQLRDALHSFFSAKSDRVSAMYAVRPSSP